MQSSSSSSSSERTRPASRAANDAARHSRPAPRRGSLLAHGMQPDVSDPSDSSSGGPGVPRQYSGGERGATSNLPDVTTTPSSASVVSASPPRSPHDRQHQQHPPPPPTLIHPVHRNSGSHYSSSSSLAGGGGGEASVSGEAHAGVSQSLFSSPGGGSSGSLIPPSPGLSCMECGMLIQGAVFMLHDQAYCCQRHRLVAYHKTEKGGNGSSSSSAGGGAASGAQQQPPSSPRSPASPATGLRATYATWM